MTLKASLLSLSLLTAPPAAAQEGNLVLADFEPPQTGALQDAFCATQYTIAGDTNHDSLDVAEFLASDQIFDIMEVCGIDHVFAEQAMATQPYYDSLISGEIDMDEFVEQMQAAGYGQRGEDILRAHGRVALEATERGMVYYAAQMPTGAAEITEMAFYQEMAFRLWEELMPEDLKEDFNRKFFKGEDIPEDRMQAIVQALHDNQTDPRFKSAQDLFARIDAIKAEMEENGVSRTDDKLLHEFVTERVGEDEKALIIVGNGHPKEPVIGIYDRLGDQSATWIAVYETLNKWDPSNRMQPDAIVDLENDRIFSPSTVEP